MPGTKKSRCNCEFTGYGCARLRAFECEAPLVPADLHGRSLESGGFLAQAREHRRFLRQQYREVCLERVVDTKAVSAHVQCLQESVCLMLK